jgi:predicted metal-dependent phosphoesterase TrpH
MHQADLHLHTTASDGVFSPADVVRFARARGLAAIAITDHDVTDGVEEAQRAGAGCGLDVLPGVEINTDFGPTEVHILGYCMDLADPEFQRVIAWLRDGRVERARQMVTRLVEMGVPISWERVEEISGPGAMGRPHIAQALREAGHIETLQSAFDLYIGAGGPAYVPRERFDAFEAIAAIRAAGGVAVVAHPGKIHNDSLIRPLVDAGLGGIEVCHPDHDEAQTARYRRMADELGLVWTGGSDFHGNNESRPLAGRTVPVSQVEALRSAAG